MVARATRDLRPGTELTWWYQVPSAAPANNYTQRQKKLRQSWGFVCDCAMCADEKGTSAAVLGKRRGLVVGLERFVVASLGSGGHKGDDAVVDRAETAVKAMAATYSRPASEVPRLAIWEVMQTVLGKVLAMGQVQPLWMVRLILPAFESLGYVIEGGMGGTIVVRQWGLLVDGVVECWMFLRDAYRQMAPELVAHAEVYAKTAYRMVFDEDETFETFGDAI